MRRAVALLVGCLGVLALVGPWLAPYAPDTQFRQFLYAPPMPPHVVHDGGLRAPFVYPVARADRLRRTYEVDRRQPQPLPWFAAEGSPSFLLGSDSLGRDLLSRLLHGARLSVSLSLIAVAGALFIGTLLGAAAGTVGGWLDDVVMRVAELVAVLPVIYLVLVLRAALPAVMPTAAIFSLMAAIFALAGWPFVARGVRNIIASEREREFVSASRAMGAGTGAILRRHLLPACAGYLIVQATVLLPAFILAEATLSYVGLGFPEHVASWGTMLREAANINTMTQFPWMLAPALAIFLVVLSANAILQSDKIEPRTPATTPSSP